MTLRMTRISDTESIGHCKPMSYMSKVSHKNTIPQDLCMAYLPTFTTKITQMKVNIPYMDPMGIEYCSSKIGIPNFLFCQDR